MNANILFGGILPVALFSAIMFAFLGNLSYRKNNDCYLIAGFIIMLFLIYLLFYIATVYK